MTNPTDQTTARSAQVATLLHKAAETHHVVYSDWLLSHGHLDELLGKAPVRSHLTAELVLLDQRYSKTQPQERWEEFYAEDLIGRFAA